MVPFQKHKMSGSTISPDSAQGQQQSSSVASTQNNSPTRATYHFRQAASNASTSIAVEPCVMTLYDAVW